MQPWHGVALREYLGFHELKDKPLQHYAFSIAPWEEHHCS
jgi:hypothetical protein